MFSINVSFDDYVVFCQGKGVLYKMYKTYSNLVSCFPNSVPETPGTLCQAGDLASVRFTKKGGRDWPVQPDLQVP